MYPLTRGHNDTWKCRLLCLNFPLFLFFCHPGGASRHAVCFRLVYFSDPGDKYWRRRYKISCLFSPLFPSFFSLFLFPSFPPSSSASPTKLAGELFKPPSLTCIRTYVSNVVKRNQLFDGCQQSSRANTSISENKPCCDPYFTTFRVTPMPH